jgi:hypothetical protein
MARLAKAIGDRAKSNASQDSNDADNYEKFNEGETAST